jgi:virulence-associated protein VagC
MRQEAVEIPRVEGEVRIDGRRVALPPEGSRRVLDQVDLQWSDAEPFPDRVERRAWQALEPEQLQVELP